MAECGMRQGRQLAAAAEHEEREEERQRNSIDDEHAYVPVGYVLREVGWLPVCGVSATDPAVNSTPAQDPAQSTA